VLVVLVLGNHEGWDFTVYCYIYLICEDVQMISLFAFHSVIYVCKQIQLCDCLNMAALFNIFCIRRYAVTDV